MNPESTDQLQGQESASIDSPIALQNQSVDTPDIQLQHSEVDLIAQNYRLDAIVNLTSSPENHHLLQSSSTQASSKAHTCLISDLNNLLVCEKLPATDSDEFYKEWNDEEFIKILEALSETQISNGLLIEKEKLSEITQRYENLKSDDALMKILFHKFCCKQNEADFLSNEIFSNLKNFQTENGIFIFKDLCETFERIVIPKTQELLSSIKSMNYLTWNVLNDSIKSTIFESFIDFQGFYFPLKDLIQDQPEHLQSLNSQQIIDIIRKGFTKVSKFEHLNSSFYLKRFFIQKDKKHLLNKKLKKQVCNDYTKNLHDLKLELKEKKSLVISDNFGTGKTSTLKCFARSFKKYDNKLWISYIDAGLQSNIFEKIHKIHDWNVDGLADFMVKILDLSGIEVPIFKQKFMNNQVILLWDHIDEKFQLILIDFAWNIKQLTENQQIIATRSQNSMQLAEKFGKISYKLVPLSTNQINKFHRTTEDLINYKIGPQKFLLFCESIELGERKFEDGHKVFSKINMLTNKLIMQALADLKVDLDETVDLFSLIERVFVKQLMDNPLKLQDKSEPYLTKYLQVQALNTVFGYDLIGPLQKVKDYINAQPPISSLEGIFGVNFETNTVEFQHKIIKQYFVATFMMDNVFHVHTNEFTIKEAKILVIIIATIITNHPRIFSLINFALPLKYKNPKVLDKLQENFVKIIKKSQYWPIVKESFNPTEPKFIDNIEGNLTLMKDYDCWKRFYRCIPIEDMRHDTNEKEKKGKHQAEIKKDNKPKNKPSVKGVTSMKKLNCNHEISNELNEFLRDADSGDIDV